MHACTPATPLLQLPSAAPIRVQPLLHAPCFQVKFVQDAGVL